MPLSTTPHSEQWVFMAIMLLFFLLVAATMLSPHWMSHHFQKLTRISNRTDFIFNTTIRDFQSSVLLTVFSIGVVTLFFYLRFHENEMFSVHRFISLSGILLAYLLLKLLMVRFLGFVFFLTNEIQQIKHHVLAVFYFMGLLLFPITVVYLYWLPPIPIKILDFIVLMVVGVGITRYTVLLFQFFYKKILDFLYIMLYLCTLEILPLIGLFQAFRIIIKGV